jgi:hypothetical protein
MSSSYTVKFLPKSSIAPAFGHASKNEVIVRQDLRPRVKKFVTAHELHHLNDKANWGSWVGKEIRTNLVCGIKDPVGTIATIAASLNRERLNFYINRFRQKA